MSAPRIESAARPFAPPAPAAVAQPGPPPVAGLRDPVLRHGHPVWWRPAELALLDRLYPTQGSRIARLLGRTPRAVVQRAHLRGLRYVAQGRRK